MAYDNKAATDLSRDRHVIAPTIQQDFSRSARLVVSLKASLSEATDLGAETKFRRLERRWKRNTEYMSSLADKYLDNNYAAIIGMGPAVVPLILRSLRQSPNDWFYALRALTGANPVSAADAGDITKMAESWLKWGARKGLC